MFGNLQSTIYNLQSAMTQTLACHSCGHANRLVARYCGACGRLLAAEQRFALGTLLGADGRYRVEQRLGAGGFGEAYLVEDGQLQRLCVAKRLKLQPTWSPERTRTIVEHFEREAQLLVALNNPGHPNIPEIFAYLPASHCLVMKYGSLGFPGLLSGFQPKL
ncbi:hypothetical protein [Candidatus Viridilinea mediisalina]|uniref:Protein kinase domain-containing protein n=1 Tax=Candidatus Viridilinea mediisalina TaxID=2024553 RepID=A0A2A6RFU8_9CHLR|nr:hypothetical protein [Candidatus Viridilinea mediisalina]PDW01758.1 hypothetical protein CJ255_17415 [Candidatus Viridilinea mediisalina]